MPATHAPRPHRATSTPAVGAVDPTRQANHIHVSTTATGTSTVDFLAVERAVNGDLPTPHLNHAEQQLAVLITSVVDAGRA